jgi:hypothetical protein
VVYWGLTQMSPTDASTAEQKPAAKSRPARTRVLRTAQIYAVRGAEALHTGDITVAVLVGDEACEPHTHGLRAPRERWVELVGTMAAEDAEFAALLRARLS